MGFAPTHVGARGFALPKLSRQLLNKVNAQRRWQAKKLPRNGKAGASLSRRLKLNPLDQHHVDHILRLISPEDYEGAAAWAQRREMARWDCN